MTKIFRRETLVCGKNEKKPETRKRDVIINFRVSPEEKRLIDARIDMIGLSKASFLIQSCLYQAVLVKGNIKTFDKINSKMQEIYKTYMNADREPKEYSKMEAKALAEIADKYGFADIDYRVYSSIEEGLIPQQSTKLAPLYEGRVEQFAAINKK